MSISTPHLSHPAHPNPNQPLSYHSVFVGTKEQQFQHSHKRKFYTTWRKYLNQPSVG